MNLLPHVSLHQQLPFVAWAALNLACLGIGVAGLGSIWWAGREFFAPRLEVPVLHQPRHLVANMIMGFVMLAAFPLWLAIPPYSLHWWQPGEDEVARVPREVARAPRDPAMDTQAYHHLESPHMGHTHQDRTPVEE